MSVRTREIQGGLCEITQEYKGTAHNGIDIVNQGYTLGYITAHSDGVVVGCRNNCNGFEKGSYGNYVKIKHDNGYYTLYGHMAYNTVRVSVGQRVSKGEILGYMGNTGYSFGGHLHFEVRNPSDVRIDPTPYLDADLPSTSNKVNAFYRVKTQKHGWLKEVENLEDYAGWENSPIIGLAMRVDVGSIKYRVTTVSGKTLGWITGCDIDDYISGWAGNGEPIALVEAYYFTPDNIRPYQYAYYKVNDYPYQKDLVEGNGFDGFAGESGVTATKFQMYIGD